MSFSKRNELLKQEKCTEKVRKYSIKKLGIGVASVLIGSIFYLGTVDKLKQMKSPLLN